MCPNRHSPDYPMEDSVHRHSNTNIQQPSHSPWPPHSSYHVIRGRSDHHKQKAHHTHQHRANATKVSSRLTDKDRQPPVYQVGLGQRVYILPGALWATLGHLPPIPQHPRTAGHKAFRSQLTANKLGGIRFSGVGPKWSTVQPRSARANPLWQPRTLGIWGRDLPTKIPHLSGTPDAHGSDLQLMPPPGT